MTLVDSPCHQTQPGTGSSTVLGHQHVATQTLGTQIGMVSPTAARSLDTNVAPPQALAGPQ